MTHSTKRLHSTTIQSFLDRLYKQRPPKYSEWDALIQQIKKDGLGYETPESLMSQMNTHVWTMCLNVALIKVANNDVHALLEYGKNAQYTFSQDFQGQTPAHYAIRSRYYISENSRSILLEKILNFDPESVVCANRQGDTALHYAAYADFLPEATLHKILFKNINSKNVDGKTPLHIAAQRGNLEFAQLLLKNGADIQAKDKRGRSPLHLAAKEGHCDFVGFLLQNEADIDALDNAGETTLVKVLRYYSTQNTIDYTSIIRLLIIYGANDNVSDKSGVFIENVLHQAVEEENLGKIQLLVTSGVSRNAQNVLGQTPLHIAVQNGRVEVVKCLLQDNGMDINAVDSAGRIPVQIAAAHGKVEIVQALWEYEESVQSCTQDQNWQTVFQIALEQGQVAVLQFVIDNEIIDIDMQDEQGRTTLHIAVEKGQVEVIQYLLKDEGDIKNIEDNEGRTPLLKALLLCSPKNLAISQVPVQKLQEIAIMLIQKGALQESIKNQKQHLIFQAAAKIENPLPALKYALGLQQQHHRFFTAVSVLQAVLEKSVRLLCGG